MISAFSYNTTQAQLLKKLKKRVQQATEEVVIDKVAQKTAQETGKAMDSLLDIDPDYQSTYQYQINQMMIAGSQSIPVEESYTFDNKILYQMEIITDGNPSKVNYEMWFSNKREYMATRVESNDSSDNRDMPSSMLSILDEKNKAMIILMEEQKFAQILSMDQIKNVAVQENVQDSVNTVFNAIQKTGSVKDILGYTCEEFISKNDTNTFSFWVTEELDLFQKNMFFNLSSSLGGNSFTNVPDEAKGVMMEMHFEDSKRKEKGTMTVIDIETLEKTIQTKDYQLMSLGQYMSK